MKQEIIRKTMVLLGSNSGAYSGSQSGNAASKAENLCEEFLQSAIEEVFLSVKWDFALKYVLTAKSYDVFTSLPTITDCMKIAVITPSNTEFYVVSGKIYIKSDNVVRIIYYSKTTIYLLFENNQPTWRGVSQSFKLLVALGLASRVAFALYSDSLFADGLKKQYLIALEQAKKLHHIDYNLVNSGEV